MERAVVKLIYNAPLLFGQSYWSDPILRMRVSQLEKIMISSIGSLNFPTLP